jgi:hypothetical protein
VSGKKVLAVDSSLVSTVLETQQMNVEDIWDTLNEHKKDGVQDVWVSEEFLLPDVVNKEVAEEVVNQYLVGTYESRLSDEEREQVVEDVGHGRAIDIETVLAQLTKSAP